MRAVLFALVFIVVLSGVACSLIASAEERPDIVVVVLDDMRSSDWQALPQTQGLLLPNATWLTNYIIVTPLCCPSRSSMLSGRYSHNTGVYDNNDSGKPGGWKAFRDDEASALPTLLTDYDTALVGKYLNEYNPEVPVPGWDTFLTYPGKSSYSLDGGYSTDVQRSQAIDFLTDGASEPKFLWFTPYAPHNPASYAERHADAFPDKPGLDGDRLRSILAVDEAIAAMYAVADPDTVWIIVSDNGFLINQHNITGKNVPYDPAQRVTALVRIPGVDYGIDNRITANIDIFATVLTAAGYPVPDNDGRAWQDSWKRDGILIEGWPNHTNPDTYHGIWTKDATYAEWGDRKWLWFDSRQNWNELTDDNKRFWNAWLDRLLGCSGDNCRAAEELH